ncbi:UNVERIFIED_CONTAM: nucleoside deaminase [Kocuria sp. CPCC 205274]|jgi:guanine deaminase|uniref:Cytosine deaminase n=2 Tax=Kocuria rosea TaxID=1275 RepID=A0A0W8INF3_KOCRO|nr:MULTISPECIES: nucleoside deaminase [Kocuria]KUG61711.1 cytosine deaminase [Kocuria polaris]TDL41016.1 nucleoside deaminase [Kocuria rosea]
MSTIHETTPRTQVHLERAVELAAENAAGDGGPFGAVVVTADGREFPAVNRVTADHDPTAHAEVMAIRSACRELGTFDLSGAVLYTSCEPCPLCLSASLWARLDAVYFAADRHDAAAGGFDDAEFYEFFARSAQERDRALPVRHVALATRTEPFEAWAGNAQRTAY